MCIRDRVYANSIIPISEIGKTVPSTVSPAQNNGLQCITDRVPCCKTNIDVRASGERYFPNGTVVPPQNSATSFYTNRGDDGTVNLNRINSNITFPIGLFCCVVPDATGISQTLCTEISKLLISQHAVL